MASPLINATVFGLCALLAACGGQIGGPSQGDGDGDGDGDVDGGATGLIDYDPSNIDADFLTSGMATINITDDVTIDSMTGEITGPGAIGGIPAESIFVVVQQADGPALGVFSWESLTISSDAIVTVQGPNALIFAVGENVTIDGVIIAKAIGAIAGPGGFAGGDDLTPAGGGPGGGGTIAAYDAGGGGGGFADLGGSGGLKQDQGPGPGGSPGQIAGSENNVPLLGGSGGARGGSAANAGHGGGGGGAVQISARGEIRIGALGGIDVAGGGGEGGDNDEAGGGGGSGGAVLLEARFIVVDGILAANGGGGGAGANENNQGQPGLAGAFDISVATGGAGNGEGSAGGDGAAADNMIGGDGSPTIGNSGGGGGSGGRIHVRSREPSSMAGVTSPTGSLSSSAL